MSDQDQRPGGPGDDPGGTPGGHVPEEAPMEVEAPRRAASAEFDVRSEMGSEAQLREAMDPANQSLREALRLSFRVLQVVIVVLLVVFVFSGFQQVDTQQSGVMLRFGRIVGEEGRQALEPGPRFNLLPYPAGEFVLFQDSGRFADLGGWFWPDYGRASDFDAAVESATANTMLMPGPNARGQGSGYVLTSGGDIAHVQLRGRYEIDDPVAYVNAVRDRTDEPGAVDADRLVRLAMQRATVHVASKLDVQSFTEFTEQEQEDVRRLSQRMLDRVDSGMRLAELQTPIDPTPALAIRKAARDLQEVRRQSEERLESAREQAQGMLISAAGPRWNELLDLIAEYEDAVAAGDDAAAEAVLDRVDEAMQQTSSGEVATIIQQARAYRSFVDQGLGADARRFASLLPRYRENPGLVINQLWAEAYGTVVSYRDTELMRVPGGIGAFSLQLAGDTEVSEVRRENRLQRRERETMQQAIGNFATRADMRASDIQTDGRSGRQLDRSGNPTLRRED